MTTTRVDFMVWAALGRMALTTIGPMVLGSMFNKSAGAEGQTNNGPSLFNRVTDGAIGFGVGEIAERLIPGQQEGLGSALGMAGLAGAFNTTGSDENSMVRVLGAVAGAMVAHYALGAMGFDTNSLVSKGIMAAVAFGGAQLAGSLTESAPSTAAPTQKQTPALPAPSM